MTLSALPTVNACLNATSALMLALGYRFVRQKKISAHRACMLGAFASSTIFLASYLYYHAHVGSVRFPGHGWPKVLYLTILISHSTLAVSIVPMALRTLWFAGTGRFDRHVPIARKTLPLWLYVSVTGVVVYTMLYIIPWQTRLK